MEKILKFLNICGFFGTLALLPSLSSLGLLAGLIQPIFKTPAYPQESIKMGQGLCAQRAQVWPHCPQTWAAGNGWPAPEVL